MKRKGFRGSRAGSRSKRYKTTPKSRVRKRKAWKTKTNKQLTRAVSKLWKQHAIKAVYKNQNGVLTSITSPQIVELTDIFSGEATDQHEGDKITLRGLDIHGQVAAQTFNGVSQISQPTRWSVMVVSTTVDVGIPGVPSYSQIFDATTTPSLMCLQDGFRQLNNETLGKLKILAKHNFTLEPHYGTLSTGTALPCAATYPSYRYWSINLKLGNAKVEYRTGTTSALNRRLFLMISSSSAGAGDDIGLVHSFVSKLTFYDVE